MDMSLALSLTAKSGLKLVNPPSGHLASAPAASESNQNLFYMSTDFGLCKYVSVFNNAGSDWIDCGRPTNLISLLAPNVASTVCAVIQSKLTSGSGYIWSIASSGTQIQNGLYHDFGRASLGGAVGENGSISSPTTPISSSSFSQAILSTDGATFAKAYNASVLGTVTKGSILVGSNLFICGRTDGASVNFEGRIASVAFYSGYNTNGSCSGLTLVDRLDLNKWDGTGTVYFDSGHACTVTDGTPFTAKSYSLIPTSLLQ